MPRLSLTNRWALLALVWVMRFAMGMQVQSIAALSPFFRAQQGFSHGQIGTLMGVYYLLGALVSLPAGLLGSRIGGRRATLAGLTLMVLGGALQGAGAGFAVLATARVLAGSGAVIMIVQTQRLVTDWFADKEIATALAIMNVAMGLSLGVSMALLPAIADVTGWVAALHFPTLCLLVTALLALVMLRDSPRSADDATPLFALNRREVVLMLLSGGSYSGIIAGYIVFVAFAPLVLIGRGASVTAAGTLVSLVGWVSLVSVPLGGFLADRTGYKNALIAVGSLSAAAACVLFAASPWPVVWLLLFGSLRGGCTGAVNSLPSEVLRPESRSTGFGLFSAAQYAVVVVGSAVAGYAVDLTGDNAAGVWVAGILWVFVAGFLVLFRVYQRRWYGVTPATAAA